MTKHLIFFSEKGKNFLSTTDVATYPIERQKPKLRVNIHYINLNLKNIVIQ